MVGGISYADEDILLYTQLSTTGSWSLFFDGSAARLPESADLDAIGVGNGLIHMSFTAPVTIPALGSFDDSDTLTFNTNIGRFISGHVGSNFGLTTSAENVDALAAVPVGFMMSTAGKFNVDGATGGTVKGQDEDLLLLTLFGQGPRGMSLLYDGSADGLGAEDVTSIAYTIQDSLFLTTENAFSAGGVRGAGGDIWEIPNFSTTNHEFHLFWDASEHGFPKVDAIEVIPVIVD